MWLYRENLKMGKEEERSRKREMCFGGMRWFHEVRWSNLWLLWLLALHFQLDNHIPTITSYQMASFISLGVKLSPIVGRGLPVGTVTPLENRGEHNDIDWVGLYNSDKLSSLRVNELSLYFSDQKKGKESWKGCNDQSPVYTSMEPKPRPTWHVKWEPLKRKRITYTRKIFILKRTRDVKTSNL